MESGIPFLVTFCLNKNLKLRKGGSSSLDGYAHINRVPPLVSVPDLLSYLLQKNMSIEKPLFYKLFKHVEAIVQAFHTGCGIY